MKMSSKKIHPNEAKAEQAAEKAEAPVESAESSAAAEAPQETAELQKQLTEALAQAAEYKDGWQRSVADFQNYRRRVEAEKSETYQMAVANVIKRYLPVLDDLERAVEARPTDLAWAEGVVLICRKLESILDAEGIKKIEAMGQKFDPNFHEAASLEAAEGVESGTVLGVIRNGYILGERVIRPAMVRVAK
jgi:molecular chaperone GrpE